MHISDLALATNIFAHRLLVWETYMLFSAPFGTTFRMPLRNLWNPRTGLLMTRYGRAFAALTCGGFVWWLALTGAMLLRRSVSLSAVQEDNMRGDGSLYALRVELSGSSSICRADEKCVVKAYKSAM
jgi:hypothetical protein